MHTGTSQAAAGFEREEHVFVCEGGAPTELPG